MKRIILLGLILLVIGTSFSSKERKLFVCFAAVLTDTHHWNIVRVVAAESEKDAIKVFDSHLNSDADLRGRWTKGKNVYWVSEITNDMILDKFNLKLKQK